RRHHLRRGVHAVDVPARVLRRGHAGRKPPPSGSERARVGGAGAGAPLHPVDRRLPRALHRAHGGERAGPHQPGTGQGGGHRRPGGELAMNPLAAPALVAPAINLAAIGPVLVLAVTALVLLVLDLLPPRGHKEHLGVVGLAGVVGSLVVSLYLWGADERAFKGMVILDGFAIFFNLVIVFGVGLVLLQPFYYARRQGAESGEFYILVILAGAGMILMAGAGDLIVVFLGLETMSLA